MLKPCPFPFHSLAISTTGNLSPCCAYTGSFGNFSDIANLQTHWMNHPKWQAMRANELAGVADQRGCVNCLKNEGLTTVRKDCLEELVRPNPTEFCKSVELKHLDIAFGNACNLTCAMCKSEFSTSWYQTDLEFSASNPWRKSSKPWSMPFDKIDQLVDWIPNGLSLEVKGGEPLMDKKFLYFLRRLRALGKSVSLHLVTNFTLVDAEKVDLLREHLNRGINISVDGCGKTYEWMRGFPFAKLEDNLVKFLPQLYTPEHYCNFNFVSTAFNVTAVAEFWRWVENLSLRTGVEITPNFNFIATNPGYVSPALTPEPDLAVAQLNHTLELVKQTKIYTGPYANFRLRRVVEGLESVRTFIAHHAALRDAETMRHCHEWRMQIAKMRGWDIFEPAPSVTLLNP